MPPERSNVAYPPPRPVGRLRNAGLLLVRTWVLLGADVVRAVQRGKPPQRSQRVNRTLLTSPAACATLSHPVAPGDDGHPDGPGGRRARRSADPTATPS